MPEAKFKIGDFVTFKPDEYCLDTDGNLFVPGLAEFIGAKLEVYSVGQGNDTWFYNVTETHVCFHEGCLEPYVESESAPDVADCTCDMTVLMICGCQCGGK